VPLPKETRPALAAFPISSAAERQNAIGKSAHIHPSVQLGFFNVIEPGAFIEEGVVLGSFNTIGKGVHVGAMTVIRSYTELRGPLSIGVDCYIDSGVKCSGDVVIDDDVTVRYDAILARGCRIGAHTYICPQVMTNNLDHRRVAVGGAQIGKSCFIGTNATLAAGIRIEDEVIVGAKALVTRDCSSGNVYIGIPARPR